jgi:hypothetical protein
MTIGAFVLAYALFFSALVFLDRRACSIMVTHSRSNLTVPDRLLALALVVSLLMTFCSHLPHLWDRYRVVLDMQNSYWMARYQDPTLFATDYLLGKFLVEVEVLGLQVVLYPRSLGYGLLFYLASFMVDHIWLSKWLVFVLMPLCVTYLFKLGKLLGGSLTGLCLSLLFAFFMLASYQSISIASGLQRAFAVPLLIVFLYYMINERYTEAGLMMFVSALFYLPNLPLMVLTYALSLVKVERPFRLSWTITRSRLVPLVGGIVLSALVTAPALAVEFEWLAPYTAGASWPDKGEAAPLSQDLFYHSQEYAALFFSFPLGRAGILDAGTDRVNFLVLLVLGLFIYATVGKRSLRRLPGVFWRLLSASIIMYAASLFVVFGLSSVALYYPSRYTRSTLFLVALCFVGLNWTDFLDKAPKWFRRNARLLILFVVSFSLAFMATYALFPARLFVFPILWFLGLILSGMLAVVGGSSLFWLLRHLTFKVVGEDGGRGAARFVFLLAVGVITVSLGVVYIRTLGMRIINPSDPERDIYEFVGSLPKDVVLAGDPEIMSGIPLFSQRSVLFRALHPDTDAPILDFFDALYAESPETALDFCQRYNLSYLVLDKTDFAPDYLAEGDFFYQPYNDMIAEMVAGRTNFVLLHLQPVFASGPFVVIKCDAETLLAGN